MSCKITFLVGSGRSGTTVLYQRLCADLEVGYIPAVVGSYPRLGPPAALLSRFLSGRGFGPSNEAIGFLERFGVGHTAVRRLGRPMRSEDLSQAQRRGLNATLNRICRLQGRNGLLIKNTGATARVSALSAALPEAKFIHIVRDGRAVAASLSKVGFFPQLPLWWAGSRLANDLVGEYGSLPLVAMAHWERQVRAARESLASLPEDRWLEVEYDEFVRSPLRELERVHAFMGRDTYPFSTPEGFAVDGVSTSSLEAWREVLSDTEQALFAQRYGRMPTGGAS